VSIGFGAVGIFFLLEGLLIHTAHWGCWKDFAARQIRALRNGIERL